MRLFLKKKIKSTLVILANQTEKILQLFYFNLKTKYISFKAPMFNTNTPRLFNLDLHISVIRDLTYGMRNFDVEISSWSISGANRSARSFFRFSDPVKHVNRQNWRNMDLEKIKNFQNEYRKFLKKFDGFIVTYTPTFAELFVPFEKPILVNIPIRYETPYSDNQESWSRINNEFIKQNENGLITFWANNKGDKDYLKYFTGIEPELVPSMCDYLQLKWNKDTDMTKVIMVKDATLVKEIE